MRGFVVRSPAATVFKHYLVVPDKSEKFYKQRVHCIGKGATICQVLVRESPKSGKR